MYGNVCPVSYKLKEFTTDHQSDIVKPSIMISGLPIHVFIQYYMSPALAIDLFIPYSAGDILWRSESDEKVGHRTDRNKII